MPRRARRILPAAGVVMVATAIASALVLRPLIQGDVSKDIVACALNVGNWRFIAVQTDYLDAGRAQSPMLHYWSLGVEEQFYLVWAPLALLVVLAARRLRLSAFAGLAVTLSAVVGASLFMCVFWTSRSAPLAYLSSASRAWQFGVGGLAALFVRRFPGDRLPGPARAVLGWGGAAAVLGAMVAFTTTTAFPGYAALLPTLGTTAIIVAGTSSPARGSVGSLLATPPVRAVGRLSYTWYLWHWPVLILVEALVGPQSWPVKAALMLASAVPAYLTMRLVENPLRLWPRLSRQPGWSLGLGAAAITIPLVAGLLLHWGAKAALAEPSTVAAAPLVATTDGVHLQDPPPSGTPMRPSPGDARNDFPPLGYCQVPPQGPASPECLFGDTASPTRVVLFGDSHAAQWFPAVEALARRRGWAVEVLTKAGCPAAWLTVSNGQLGRVYTECDTWRQSTIQRILNEPKPALIFVSQVHGGYSGDENLLEQAWLTSLNILAGAGAPIIYLRDTPYPNEDVPACVSGAMRDPNSCSFPRAGSIPPDPTADLIGAHLVHQTYLVDLNGVLCPGDWCDVVRDGILIYRDSSHLTATAAALLSARLEKALVSQSVLPEPTEPGVEVGSAGTSTTSGS
jgi:peptidoglycan/LPS O-acetylase OafA/YrhL